MPKHLQNVDGVIITIDESGKNEKEKYSIMGATVIKDRRNFRNTIENFGFKKEIGFSGNKELTPLVFVETRPYVRKSYAVRYVDEKSMNENEKRRRDEKIMEKLQGIIMEDEEEIPFLIMVDSGTRLDESTIRKVFTGSRVVDSNHNCVIVPSNAFAEMQGNDYYVGALKKSANGNDAYIRHLRNGHEIVDYNKKSRRVNSPQKVYGYPATNYDLHKRTGSPMNKHSHRNIKKLSSVKKAKPVRKKKSKR